MKPNTIKQEIKDAVLDTLTSRLYEKKYAPERTKTILAELNKWHNIEVDEGE